MKKVTLILIAVLLSGAIHAQILTPVKWSYASKSLSKTEAIILIKATINSGWHIYSQHVADGGPVPTSISFNPSNEYTLVGKTSEPKPVTKFEKAFSMNVSYFENSVIFQQRVKIRAGKPVIKGKLEFMVCNDQKCLPPDEVSFSIPIK
ncbi:protein-disulfide reductase DsbD domain-containing protein [Arcticibacter eurypsychrophilus]|uniref:protein-disulfide reductase DsbD domain-containing protein n=1 Tax=Arcticibacter eurypsychrophilus TaxID=1434752 RepID=UPI00084D6AE2|nr:protein-disulfide reductase DsbD domain-containing protein [Arcticibacter eurypsychrophilus]